MSMVTVPPRVPLLEAPCVEDMSRARRRRLRARRVAVRQSLLHTAKLKNLLNDITEPFVWEHSLFDQAPPGNPLCAGSYFQTCTPVEVTDWSSPLNNVMGNERPVTGPSTLSTQASVFVPGPSLRVWTVTPVCQTVERRAGRETQSAEELPSRLASAFQNTAQVVYTATRAAEVRPPERKVMFPALPSSIDKNSRTNNESAAEREGWCPQDEDEIKAVMARLTETQGGDARFIIPGTSAGVTRLRAIHAVQRLNRCTGESIRENAEYWQNLEVEVRRLALGELQSAKRRTLLAEVVKLEAERNWSPSEGEAADMATLAASILAVPITERGQAIDKLATKQKNKLLAFMREHPEIH